MAGLRKAAAIQTLASLIWIPQAALLATAVGRIADGGGFNDILWLAVSIALLGTAKAVSRRPAAAWHFAPRAPN